MRLVTAPAMRRRIRIRARILRLRWHRTGRRARLIVCGAAAGVVVLLGAGALFLPGGGPDGMEPAELVEAYLSALAEGDADTALDLAEQHPKGEEARFLTPTATGSGWTVEDVTEGERSGRFTTVTAVLADAAGTRHEGTFAVRFAADGRARLAAPFVRVVFGASPLRYTAVDEAAYDLGPHRPGQTYLMFPGAHMLYPDGVAGTDVKPMPLTLLPGADGPHRVEIPAFAPTEDGLAAATAAIDAYVDACAESTEARPDRCPFAAGGTVGELDGHEFADDLKDVSWEVEEYPRPGLVADGAYFRLDGGERGAVRIRATGVATDLDGNREAEFDVDYTCAIAVDSLLLTLSGAGDWTVRHALDPEVRTSSTYPRPDMVGDTCAM